jgi:general secretion pathway protein J
VSGPAPRRDAGLTLIELAVALAIFALVAVMGMTALTAMTRQQASLSARAAGAEALDRTLSLLRADLRAGVPLLFDLPAGGGSSSALAARRDGFAITLAGQPVMAGDPAGTILRARWTLDRRSATLTRQVLRTDAATAPTAPEVTLLSDVRDLRLRSYRRDSGWSDGPGHADGGLSSELPDGVEVTLEMDGGPIHIRESFR